MFDREIDFEKVTFEQIAEVIGEAEGRVNAAATSKEEYSALMLGSLLAMVYVLASKLAQVEKESAYEA